VRRGKGPVRSGEVEERYEGSRDEEDGRETHCRPNKPYRLYSILPRFSAEVAVGYRLVEAVAGGSILLSASK